MAITTRFISTSNAPFVPNGNKMDPGAASAAARAQGAASNQVMNALSGLAASIDQQQEKVDDFYAARAKADVEVDYNKKYMEASGQIQSGGNFGAQSVQMLQEMAKPYVDNAPNDATRNALIKSFMGLGKSAQIQGDRLQFNINEKTDLQGLVDYASKSSALLTLGKVGEEKAYANLEEMAAGLAGKSYDQQKIQKILGDAKDQVYLQSRLQEATTNPFEVLKAAEAGAYTEKGKQVQDHIIKTAANTINSHSKQAKDEANKILEGIYAGKPADASAGVTVEKLANLFQQTKDPTIREKYEELATAHNWDTKVRNFNPAELMQEKMNTEKRVAAGEISPEQGGKMINTVNNRLQWAQNDPFAYFQIMNPTAVVGPLPAPKDPLPVIKQKMASRYAAADAASELMNQPVPPLSGAELKNVFSNWSNLTVRQQQEQLQVLADRPEYTPAIAQLAEQVMKDMTDKSAESLVPALQLMNLNPDLAATILKGSEHLKNKTVDLSQVDKQSQELLQSALGDIYVDDPAKRSQILTAAKAVAADTLANSGKSSTDTSAREAVLDAINKVSGVVTHKNSWSSKNNHKMIPPKYGMTSEEVTDMLDALTSVDLAKVSNGTPSIFTSTGEAKPFTDKPGKYRFEHIRSGMYRMTLNGKEVRNESGNPLLVDLKRYHSEFYKK